MNRKSLLKVFTIKHYKHTGPAGRIKNLARGFVNYLIKKGIVEYYNNQQEFINDTQTPKKEVNLNFSQEDLVLNFYRSANKFGGLYEKIKSEDILSGLKEKSIDTNHVILFSNQVIRNIGSYTIEFQFYDKIFKLIINVIIPRGNNE